MAFWGVEVKPGNPYTHSCEKSKGRLRISQATLGLGGSKVKSIVQCNLGGRSPVLLCVLLPNKTESCHLDLEFEEADDVIFSVIGPQSVYLTGYYLQKYQQSNPHSDTESYGLDIENTQTEGSSYCSDDDKYEDSFIDDVQLHPSPVLGSKALNDTIQEIDIPEDEKGCDKHLRNRNQVIEPDSDAMQENENGDGYLSSALKSGRAGETSMLDDAENIAHLLVQMAEKTNNGIDCGSHSKQKVDPDIICKPEWYLYREAKIPLDGQGTRIENENYALPKKVQILEIDVSNENSLIDDKVIENKEETPIFKILQINNERDCNQSLDQITEQPNKKRKKNSKREDKTCEVLEIDGEHGALKEDQAQEVKASTNLDVDSTFLLAAGSENNQTSKKRRKELQLTEMHAGEIGGKCYDIPNNDECKQDLPCVDSKAKDILAASEEHRKQQIDNQPGKKIHKKKKKKTRGSGDLNVNVLNKMENLENTVTKYDDRAENAVCMKKRTLSNGLIIEEMAYGPPDGKIAAVGKKIKVYYTAMLKENGRIFDSNVGGAACNCCLGDEEFIDGWNIGIEGMRVGDKRRLTIPPSLGFGSNAIGENIPPYSWLVYEIELVKVRR